MTASSDWKPLEAFWPAREFLRDSTRLIPEVERCYVDVHGRTPSPGDVTSWRERVYWLASLLDGLGLRQLYMFLEYQFTREMNPIDVVLADCHPSGRLSFAVIEL